MDKIDLTQINPAARKPETGMTDESWQPYFRALRLMVSAVPEKKMRTFSCYGGYDHLHDGTRVYHGDTLWLQYCKFINGVLDAIRRGEEDYCFFIYQVAELLRYEHDRLRTKWIPEYTCFKVWLEK